MVITGLSGKPVDWNPHADWQEHAARIVAMLRRRDLTIRAVSVTGDYASNDLFSGSVLILILFVHDSRPLYTQGAVQSLEGMPVALDWVTTAYIDEPETILSNDLQAHRLATAKSIAAYDRVLRDELSAFRDHYFSQAERAQRIEHLLAHADLCLDEAADSARRGRAMDAFLWGFGPALCHAVDESPSCRRAFVRFRNAVRVRQSPQLAADVVAAYGLAGRDVTEILAVAERFQAAAETYIRTRHSESLGRVTPYWKSELSKGREAVRALTEMGDQDGAAFAALATGTAIETLMAREAPEFLGTPAYAQVAGALYGQPDIDVLRRVVRAIRTVVS